MYKRPQPPANDLDVGQGPLPQLDLRFEGWRIPEGGRRNDKTTHILFKAAQRGLYKGHFHIKYAFSLAGQQIIANKIYNSHRILITMTRSPTVWAHAQPA